MKKTSKAATAAIIEQAREYTARIVDDMALLRICLLELNSRGIDAAIIDVARRDVMRCDESLGKAQDCLTHF